MAVDAVRVFLILSGSSLMLWAGDCVPTGTAAHPTEVSPDGRYRLLNLRCSNPTQEERGALVLVETKGGARRTVYTYNREATALWSPDSQHVAVNDYIGSNVSQSLVLSVSGKAPPINVSERVLQAMSGDDIRKADHLYVSVVRWRSGDELELIAFGHTSERENPTKGFCLCFSVTLEGTVQQRRLPDTGPDLEGYCWKLAK